ncbi:TetR/AcrR family transcriptional regulator [Gordonia sp. GONU]|uniref:TetR/AcrR family transcriptional regulator n=1 Tax=Gordonia TaxID=2053 RepID=UPI00046757BA|nr:MULTISPECIES: TetR/AcrR family transcriptional regulator [Gordonia]MCR8898163.1 TetR/AcrR family transcriptional regulator [Gordonia sp. GONU]MCZ0911412.1 TetR/AcrR family transcriptional regulator [Gordonia amicalis]MCZ4650075.1 TetR/AcrR family transcriptional regulator [Gordonia amicalis]
MANRPNPAAAARAAMAAAANVTRGLEQVLTTVTDTGAKPDGRKQRWEKHKLARRTELTDGVIAAIRELGADVGMDEIAAHIGVSKTVLYRYFTDKSDVGVATTVRFFETTIWPRLTEAISDDVDEYTLTHTIIGVYVHAVDDEPNLYRFALASSPTSSPAPADSVRLVSQLVMSSIVMRMADRGADTTGAELWSHALVGGIQHVVDWWMTSRTLDADQVVDYLTMMVWSAIVGVASVDGSREAFLAAPPPLTEPAREAPSDAGGGL